MLDPTTTALRQSDAGSESFEAVECVEWHVGRHTLMRADCEMALAELDSSSIDVVVTSPPYNLGIRYSGYADDRPMTDYLAWLGRVAKQLRRCLKEDGSIFLNVSGSSTNPWIAMDAGVKFQQSKFVGIKRTGTKEDLLASGEACDRVVVVDVTAFPEVRFIPIDGTRLVSAVHRNELGLNGWKPARLRRWLEATYSVSEVTLSI